MIKDICNFCYLNQLKEKASPEYNMGDIRVTVSKSLCGWDVFLHPINLSLDDIPYCERLEYRVAWMREKTDHCTCNIDVILG